MQASSPIPTPPRPGRRRIAKALALAALPLLAPAVASAQMIAPPSTRLSYEVDAQTSGLRYGASATLDWRQDGQRYEARMELKALLVSARVQSSSGQLGAQGLRPERFSDRARKERVTRFDHDARLIQADDGSSWPLPAGLQDRLSVFIQLGMQLAAQAPAPGASWTIPVATSTAAEHWTFRNAGSENLTLAGGPLRAWHLVRKPRHEGDAEVELWLAPEIGFLPARIRIRDDGDSVDQRLLRR